MNKDILKVALQYAALGWKVFPLHSIVDGQCTCNGDCGRDAGKHPMNPRGLKEASADEEQLKKWWGRGSAPANIAIVTGETSGITVLDIDIGPGKFGAESWAEAIRDHGEPQTLMARTGSGGMHVIFKYNSALRTAGNVLGKGVDCRNDGGYIVAAPSVHRSGGRYEWLNWGTALAALPAHLSQRRETRGRPRKDDMYRGKYTLEQVEGMLDVVPADDRDLWRSVGVILGREFQRSDKAWELYVAWADKAVGKKGRNHDEIMHEAFYDISQQAAAERGLSLGTVVKAALENGWVPKAGEVPIHNFVYYGPGNNYIYRPTISQWISAAVDAAVAPVNVEGKLKSASEWLRENALCTSMTNDPALDDDYVKGYDCRDGELVKVAGAALFNTYRKATIELGDAHLAQPFLEHVHRVFPRPGDADQFLDYMAHRTQRPAEKPRFALLIAGGQGVGKDTAVEFCCPAIGPWNVANIDPSALDSSFNEFAAATLIRISEAANLHDMNRWAFNERIKVLIAGSPDYCQINPKYGQKYSVRMHCGVILTTNHLTSGIYIPVDDRRYDVIEAATLVEMKLVDVERRREYFSDLWGWFLGGGASHVAAYLHERDITKFRPNDGQRKTDAHRAVVAGGLGSDSWLDDVLEALGRPVGFREDVARERAVAGGERPQDVRRKLHAAAARLGYSMMLCPETKDGRWRIGDVRVAVYANGDAPGAWNPVVELKEKPF